MYRVSLKAKFIGITGSNGKTTTKELVREVLSQQYKVQATAGNLNNHIGVPLTILSLPVDLDFAIIEMGANHVGEIAHLCEIAKPNFGLITNIGKAHLEGFGGFEGVVRAKSELYKYINGKSGSVFVHSSNALLMELAADLNKITYGEYPNAYCQGKLSATFPYLEIKSQSGLTISTHLLGNYNFENIMAALCVGKYFGIEEKKIKHAIESFRPDNNRSQVIQTKRNTLIMDAYNANPTSMEAAINNFAAGNFENKVLILGEMLELGIESKKEHTLIVELAKNANVEKIFFAGKEYEGAMADKNIWLFENSDELALYLDENRLERKTILIKGSRGNKLEKILKFL
jgi:UDP-N-acetylmuramoyl-tripeptide--D-alanyl-D-alanine ligase